MDWTKYTGRKLDAWVRMLKNAIDAEMAAEEDGGAVLRLRVYLQMVVSDDQFLHTFAGYSKDQSAVLLPAFEEMCERMAVEEAEGLRICAAARVGRHALNTADSGSPVAAQCWCVVSVLGTQSRGFP